MTEIIYAVEEILNGNAEVEHIEYSSDEEDHHNYHE
jgi:hypothetical protein